MSDTANSTMPTDAGVLEGAARAAAPGVAQRGPPAAAQGALAFSLELVLLLALTQIAAISLVRALPWPDEWKRRRPLSCDACMGFWTSVGLSALLAGITNWQTALLHAGPALGLSLLALAWLERLRPSAPPPPPPAPPDEPLRKRRRTAPPVTLPDE